MLTSIIKVPDTHQALLGIMDDGLAAWLEDLTISSHNYDVIYADLIQKQNAIHWHNLTKGHFSRVWGVLQDEHLHYQNLKKKDKSGPIQVTKIIKTLWMTWYDLWDLYNGDSRHRANAASRRAAKKEQVIP